MITGQHLSERVGLGFFGRFFKASALKTFSKSDLAAQIKNNGQCDSYFAKVDLKTV